MTVLRATSCLSIHRLIRSGVLAGFAWLDTHRRHRGDDLDAMGFAPIETPWTEIARCRGLRLRRYGRPDAGHCALIVPAPIKRAYIWDIEPTRSPVRALLAAGLGPYLVEWTDDLDGGLAEVAGDLLRHGIDAVIADGGSSVVLVGHSLGGTLATLAAAAHPRALAGLVLLESPLRFGPEAGAFAPYTLAVPDTPADLIDQTGKVPGSLLDLFSVAADPASYGLLPAIDAIVSAGNPDLLATHLRVRRWALDELAMPARLFRNVIVDLYRDDRFYEGTLMMDGRRLGPPDVAMPILAVVNPFNRDVPPPSTLHFLERTHAPSIAILEFTGEPGVALQHVGVLVGRQAHLTVWPRIVAWIHGTAS